MIGEIHHPSMLSNQAACTASKDIGWRSKRYMPGSRRCECEIFYQRQLILMTASLAPCSAHALRGMHCVGCLMKGADYDALAMGQCYVC